jgi:hypothetical protein
MIAKLLHCIIAARAGARRWWRARQLVAARLAGCHAGHLSGPSRGGYAASAFPTVNRFSTALLNGRFPQ